jgi:predicted ATPase
MRVVTPDRIRTPDQRLRVFVSSTLQEMAAERRIVLDAVRRMRLTPVMFELGARPYPPRELYRAYLAQSDVFIGLYWQSYGWVAPDEDVSGLEDEFRLSADVPRLLYVKVPAPERQPRLAAMLDDAASAGERLRLFAAPDELGDLVADGLSELLSAHYAGSARRARPAAVAGAPTAPEPAPAPLLAPAAPGLPAPRSPIVDRVAERGRAGDLLRSRRARLLTLVGPGGAGKSRLALEVATEQLAEHPDGVVLVDLAPLHRPDQVLPAVALAVGVREQGTDVFATLTDALRDRRLLLVLDNAEHVRAAADDIVRLLEGCPGVDVLVTSRMPLRVRAEVELPVGPLQRSDAVDLFVQRAQAINPAFRLGAGNAADVAELCTRLDGLPLALEIAASGTRVLTPRQLLERMDSLLAGPTAGPRDLPARQRTLRATIAWSEELLDDEVADVFRRLGVFCSGWTLEAAEVVAGSGDVLLDSLEALVDASLVQPVEHGAEVRFRMLETVREYARERLAERGELDPTMARHATYFAALAEQAEPYLVGARQTEWLDRLSSEHCNLHLALAWASDHDADVAIRMATSLWQYWEARGHFTEGRHWLERLLAASSETTPERARMLNSAGSLADWLGDYASSRRAFTDALRIARELGERRMEAASLHNLGIVLSYDGDLDAAVASIEESLAIKRTLGDERFTANSLDNLGRVLTFRGDLDRAREVLREALDTFRRVGDAFGVAVTGGNLAAAELAAAQRGAGDLDEVAALHRESLARFLEVGDDDGLAESMERIGALAIVRGAPASAARLFGAARELRAGVGSAMPPPERTVHERDVARAREELGDAAYDTAVAAGAAGGRDEAVALAREVVGADAG